MSHSKLEEERELYLSVQDQVIELKKKIQQIEDATQWDQVYDSIQDLKKRILYMEREYCE